MKKLWFNILLGLLLVITVALAAWAIFTAPHESGVMADAAIDANLYWGYALLGAGVVLALFCALFGMIQKPSSLISVGIAAVLVLIVVGVAYFIAASHQHDPAVITDIRIPNLADGDYFGAKETKIAETCLLVTYVAAGAAIVTAILTEIWRALK